MEKRVFCILWGISMWITERQKKEIENIVKIDIGGINDKRQGVHIS